MTRRVRWMLGVAAALAAPIGAAAIAASAPPHGGTISLDAHAAGGVDDPALPAFADAVGKALTAKGFTLFDDAGHAAYLGEVTLSRASVGTGYGRNPNPDAITPSGGGVAVALPTGNSNVITLDRTRIDLRIRRRDDGSTVWDGAAVTVRTGGAIATTAATLANALLEGYPEQPKEAVGVP